MVFKILLTLSDLEAAGLAEMAAREVRSPREQLRFLLRRELSSSGVLPPELGTTAAKDFLTTPKE